LQIAAKPSVFCCYSAHTTNDFAFAAKLLSLLFSFASEIKTRFLDGVDQRRRSDGERQQRAWTVERLLGTTVWLYSECCRPIRAGS